MSKVIDQQQESVPLSAKIEQLIDVSDSLVALVSGDGLSVPGALSVTGTVGVTGVLTATGGLVVPKASTIVLATNSSTAGSGFALSASKTAALQIHADDAGTLLGAAAVRAAKFRTLITVSHSNETSFFGAQNQLKIANPLDCVLTTGNRAGSWNYLEMAGTLTKTITLSGANKATAGGFSMVDWDGVGTLVLSANHVLAGHAVLTNITKGAGTFTQTGMFAGYALLNNATASYSSFTAGVYFGPNSVVTPFVFTDETDVASVTNGTILADISATANAGYIRCIIGTTVRYIPVYAVKAS